MAPFIFIFPSGGTERRGNSRNATERCRLVDGRKSRSRRITRYPEKHCPSITANILGDDRARECLSTACANGPYESTEKNFYNGKIIAARHYAIFRPGPQSRGTCNPKKGDENPPRATMANCAAAAIRRTTAHQSYDESLRVAAWLAQTHCPAPTAQPTP